MHQDSPLVAACRAHAIAPSAFDAALAAAARPPVRVRTTPATAPGTGQAIAFLLGTIGPG